MSKLIDICLTYYNQGRALQDHIHYWKQYSQESLDQINFIVIDDGSQLNPAKDNIKNHSGLDLQLYEIEQDIHWNVGGARNLAFTKAKGEWLLQLDMDTLLSAQAAEQLIVFAATEARKDAFYKFNQDFDGIHPGVILINKESFWQTGGHDEDFCGHYGSTDVHISERFVHELGFENITLKDIILERHLVGQVEIIPKAPKRNIDLFRHKKKLRNWSTDIIRFDWKQII